MLLKISHKKLPSKPFANVSHGTFFQHNIKTYCSTPISIEEKLFNAVHHGDISRIEQWYHETPNLCQYEGVQEAAINLAKQYSYQTIVQILEEQMAWNKKRLTKQSTSGTQGLHRLCSATAANSIHSIIPTRREKQNKYGMYCATQGFYKSIIISFDRSNYFKEVRLYIDKELKIELRVHCRSPFEAEYLMGPLTKLGLEFYPVFFSYIFTPKNSKSSEEFIKKRVKQVCLTLIQLNQESNSEISVTSFAEINNALNEFFIELKNGKIVETFYSNIHYEKGNNSYLANVIQNVAIHSNYEEMYELLSCGINPNVCFADQPILTILATRGVKENNILDLVKLLLSCGANPSLEFNGDTLIEVLSRLYSDVSQERKKLYLKIIAHLTASPYSRPHINIHPSMKNSDLAKIVHEANEAMLKTPYIVGLQLDHEILKVYLTMKDQSTIEIETKEIKKLQEDEKTELLQFFTSQKELNVQDKKASQYFNELIEANVGLGLVDIVKHEGVLKGIFVSELIHCDIDNKPAFIYHAKLALAKLPKEYPGLMKILIWMRGLSYEAENSFTYYEAASSRGFAMGDVFLRSNLLPIHEKIMPQLIQAVNQDLKKMRLINNRHYIHDELVVQEPESNPLKPYLSSFFMEIFKKLFYQPHSDLAVAFRNDKDNQELHQLAMTQYIDENHYRDLFTFYRKHIPSKGSIVKQDSDGPENRF